jgi:hypothetical protein
MHVLGQIAIPTGFTGDAASGWAPPDPNAAAGPNHLVQVVNNNIDIYNKNGTLISRQALTTFFGIGSSSGDPHVIYNEITGRFAVEEIITLNGSGTGTAAFAVSDSSDPTGTWHRTTINVPGFWDGYGGNGIGYNADAYVVHVNGFNNQFAVIATANNPNLNYTLITAPSNVRIGRPAPMPGSSSGGPFYFVEGNGDGVNGTGGTSGNLEVVKVTSITSGSPVFTDYQISVNNVETSVINTSWRNNQLAAIGTVGGSASIQWYLLNTSGTPALSQYGTILAPDGGSVFDPTLALAPNGDIGVNYVSVTASTMTMYLSGRAAADTAGTMRASTQAVSGPKSDGRWGDYSSCVVDINSSGTPQNTFWACNEYMNTTGQFDWKTKLANFSIGTVLNTGFETPVISNYQYNPSGGSWTFSGSPGNGSGLIANGSGFGNPNAPQGAQAAFVQSFGTISQTVSGFSPGTTYTITFSAAQRSGVDQHGGQSWNVKIDGTVVGNYNPGPGATSYADYSATFTATAATHTLAFVGTDLVGGDNTVFIDNVRIAVAALPPANAGFESPGIGNGNYRYNPSGGSWAFGGSPGNGSGLIGNGSGFSNPNAPQGIQAAFVQALGSMSQSVPGFTPGVTYKITFSAAQRPGNAQSWNVKIDNTVVGSYNPGSGATSYVDYTATFTATAATHTLAFVGTDLAGGDNTIFIDNVRLSIVPPSPPNFGFETPVVSNYQYGPTGGSWTFNNNATTSNYTGIVANGGGFNNPNAPQGAQAAFVQYYGVLSQAISGFVPGRTYTITFAAAQRPGVNQHGGQSWNVKMDSTVVGSYNPGSGATTYTDYSVTFTATTSTHTLAFVGTDLAGGDNTVFIDNVRITTVAAPLDGGAYLPPPLLSLDIGVTGPTGDASFADGVFTLTGAGTGIGGTADSFRFLYQTSSGDCANTVRVTALDNTAPDAKAGVMIRESLNANAREAGIWVASDGNIVYTSRSKTGGSSTVDTLPGGTLPCWLRIARTADTFQGYYSADGINWTSFGSTKKIKLSASAYIGIGVESGVADLLTTATLDNTAVNP